jgi:sigma-B regulation protein RsbU (phosphoserine phosphatase)
VSGDYYDFFQLPSRRLAMLLADVSGKGMPAALLAASLHATVRACAPSAGRNCGALVARVNRLLFEATSEERFATMFYAVYDPADRTLTWANAGHCSPWWVQSSSSCTRLESLTPPVGLLPTIETAQRTERLTFGDRVLIVSDGILESRNQAGEEFGEARIDQSARHSHFLSAACICAGILDEVRDFGRGIRQEDDRTVVAAILTER